MACRANHSYDGLLFLTGERVRSQGFKKSHEQPLRTRGSTDRRRCAHIAAGHLPVKNRSGRRNHTSRTTKIIITRGKNRSTAYQLAHKAGSCMMSPSLSPLLARCVPLCFQASSRRKSSKNTRLVAYVMSMAAQHICVVTDTKRGIRVTRVK
jgi:hypothetical protein